MPTDKEIDDLRGAAQALRAFDTSMIYRPFLNEKSLSTSLLSRFLAEIHRIADFAGEYSPHADSAAVTNTRGVLNDISNKMRELSAASESEYVAAKDQFVVQIYEALQTLRGFRPSFLAAAAEANGLINKISDFGQQQQQMLAQTDLVLKQIETARTGLDDHASSTIASVKSDTDKILAATMERVEQADKRIRQSAQKVSVQVAQDEFKKGQRWLRGKALCWGLLSVIFVGLFIGFAVHYSFTSPADLPKDTPWQVIYYTAIRLTILTALAAAITFCLRVLRSQIHMGEQNAHRLRIANSMAAFVESASPEQRDLVLTKLIESVIEFGSSGLISSEGDGISVPSITIEALLKGMKGKDH